MNAYRFPNQISVQLFYFLVGLPSDKVIEFANSQAEASCSAGPCGVGLKCNLITEPVYLSTATPQMPARKCETDPCPQFECVSNGCTKTCGKSYRSTILTLMMARTSVNRASVLEVEQVGVFHPGIVHIILFSQAVNQMNPWMQHNVW